MVGFQEDIDERREQNGMGENADTEYGEDDQTVNDRAAASSGLDLDEWARQDFSIATRHGYSTTQEKAWADTNVDARQHWSVREALDIHKMRLQEAIADFYRAELLSMASFQSQSHLKPLPLLARVADFATGHGDVISFVTSWRRATARLGDVVICVRQRPLLSFEQEAGAWSAIRMDSRVGKAVVCHDGRVNRAGRRLSMTHFRFPVDQCWGPAASTQRVYDDVVAPLVEWAKAGHGTTVLCYGQTGTGKTYTLGGVAEALAQDLLGTDVEMDFFEVCGDKCHDLLADRAEVHLRVDASGKVHLRGQRTLCLEKAQGLLESLSTALSLRSSEETERNPLSSRSHAICVLRFCGGELRLVDLAGSERNYETTQMTAQQHRESAKINKSLMALKDCFRARAAEQRGEKVRQPFRASRLTQVLKECFVEVSHRTVIIATVSPAATDVIHTVNTLRHVTLLAKPLEEISSEVTVDMPIKDLGTELFNVPVQEWTPDQVILWLSEAESGRFSYLVVPPGTNGKMLLNMSPQGFTELFEGTLKESRKEEEGRAWNLQAGRGRKEWVGKALFQAIRRVAMTQQSRAQLDAQVPFPLF